MVVVHETLKTACRMITTERERLKRAIEQDCLLPAHSNAAYVQSLKQALAEVICWSHTGLLASCSLLQTHSHCHSVCYSAGLSVAGSRQRRIQTSTRRGHTVHPPDMLTDDILMFY